MQTISLVRGFCRCASAGKVVRMPMSPEVIANPKSERVRRVAGLDRPQQRRKSGRFLVEGPQSVRELVRYRPDAVVDCYAQVEGLEGFSSPTVASIVDAALRRKLYVHRVTAEVMHKMSTDSQGIVAVASMETMRFAAPCLAGAGEVRDGGASPLVAAFWQVRDPGNAGTVIRAADAAGCRAVVFIDDCVDRFNPKVVRSTAGSLFHVPVLTMGTDEFFAWSTSASVAVIAADVYGTPQVRPESLVDVIRDDTDSLIATAHGKTSSNAGPAGTAVLFGNEARGLPQEVLRRVSRIVSIPIYGKAESLNLATSSAVMLYALAMARS